MSKGWTIWRYRRPFVIDGHRCRVTLRSQTNGLLSELYIDGALVASDATPDFGEEAIRNHRLVTDLPDGSRLEVEAGYISMLNTGIAVRRDGQLIHESHPGKTIAFPEKYKQHAIEMEGKSFGSLVREGWQEGVAEQTTKDNYDPAVWKRNKVPLAVDISLGLLFFAIAKLTDLTTAAFVGAGIGIVLLILQRVTKVDLLGGLAMFGIFMLLLSAALAMIFQSDEAVKYRTTAIGLISAALFFGDGFMGGRRLATRLKRYLPYTDIDVARLGIGMGLLGTVMAGANLLVALYTSTDVWLFYSTFADFILTMVLILFVFGYARGNILRDMAPRYRDPRVQ
ncbi:septation protein IspZ [Aurantiacibacter sediminis]|uniref:Septation protein IspZ n=1 Tax=Aurantiacibacter sediminis TaxID=2793064 RepID=A0ABS0N2S8_9SPHN|nr:septation protein IspZ [Aurantiacibacter sediminis]MBH5322268.1 septation protein IspZ [Aurantiacibacter sediminis]